MKQVEDGSDTGPSNNAMPRGSKWLLDSNLFTCRSKLVVAGKAVVNLYSNVMLFGCKLLATVFISGFLSLPQLAKAQSKPPALYIDKGACPFECCTYRSWRTEVNTIAYARPDKRSSRVGVFKAGTKVVGLTGEVRTRPGTFTIKKTHGKYKPGDILWVYTPLGEGFYKVWFKGRMYQEELEFVSGPFEQTFPRCEETPECWGVLDKELRVEWWVKVRSRDGWVGWTDHAENFSNIDSCA